LTVGGALAVAEERLAAYGVPTPGVDASWLLAQTLGVGRTGLELARGRVLSRDEASRFEALLERRSRREPLAYVLGEWGFRGLTLKVDRRALIPRPETETLVERCLARLSGRDRPEVLDVGTGSGAIALALADECPDARVTAFDNSPEALALARDNALATGLADRVRLVEHDLSGGFGSSSFDLVVSNPPYVDATDVDVLQPEIRDWEPRAALVANGHTAAIAAAALDALEPGGWLLLEVADGRAPEVRDLLARMGFHDILVSPDLTGRERVVEGMRP